MFNRHIIMPIVSSFLLKIGMIRVLHVNPIIFKVEKNTGDLKNGSRNSHSRRYCMHAHMWSFHYKIHTWNTEHIQTWRYLDDPNYTLIHFRLCGILQLKNSLLVHFFKWVFPIFFGHWNLYFLCISSTQFGKCCLWWNFFSIYLSFTFDSCICM